MRACPTGSIRRFSSPITAKAIGHDLVIRPPLPTSMGGFAPLQGRSGSLRCRFGPVRGRFVAGFSRIYGAACMQRNRQLPQPTPLTPATFQPKEIGRVFFIRPNTSNCYTARQSPAHPAAMANAVPPRITERTSIWARSPPSSLRRFRRTPSPFYICICARPCPSVVPLQKRTHSSLRRYVAFTNHNFRVHQCLSVVASSINNPRSPSPARGVR